MSYCAARNDACDLAKSNSTEAGVERATKLVRLFFDSADEHQQERLMEMSDYETAYYDCLCMSVAAGLREFCKWFETVTYSNGISSYDVRSKLYELVPQIDEFRSMAAERLEKLRKSAKSE